MLYKSVTIGYYIYSVINELNSWHLTPRLVLRLGRLSPRAPGRHTNCPVHQGTLSLSSQSHSQHSRVHMVLQDFRLQWLCGEAESLPQSHPDSSEPWVTSLTHQPLSVSSTHQPLRYSHQSSTGSCPHGPRFSASVTSRLDSRTRRYYCGCRTSLQPLSYSPWTRCASIRERDSPSASQISDM